MHKLLWLSIEKLRQQAVAVGLADDISEWLREHAYRCRFACVWPLPLLSRDLRMRVFLPWALHDVGLVGYNIRVHKDMMLRVVGHVSAAGFVGDAIGSAVCSRSRIS